MILKNSEKSTGMDELDLVTTNPETTTTSFIYII